MAINCNVRILHRQSVFETRLAGLLETRLLLEDTVKITTNLLRQRDLLQ